jgi:hypothetical protein
MTPITRIQAFERSLVMITPLVQARPDVTFFYPRKPSSAVLCSRFGRFGVDGQIHTLLCKDLAKLCQIVTTETNPRFFMRA